MLEIHQVFNSKLVSNRFTQSRLQVREAPPDGAAIYKARVRLDPQLATAQHLQLLAANCGLQQHPRLG